MWTFILFIWHQLPVVTAATSALRLVRTQCAHLKRNDIYFVIPALAVITGERIASREAARPIQPGTRRLLEASLRWSWTSDKWLIVSAPRKPLSLQMEAEFYVHVNHLTFEPVVHSQCEFEGVWQPDGPWPCAHRKLDPKNVAALAVSRLSNTAFQCLLMQSGLCPWSSIIFSRFSLLNLFLFYYKQIQIKITHNFLVVDFAWARRI